MQFTVKHLSLDEQREEIELKKGSPEYTQRNYKCKDCGLGFISEDVLEEHIVKHSESNGANMCDVCTLRFKSKTVLTQHKLLHSRVFVCNKCGVHIKKWSHALTHRHKCWDVCVSVCVYCKKVFNNKNSLDVHIRGVHKNIKKYVCVECKRLFGTKQRLRVHMRSHTGSKPFVCDCGRKFTTKSNLKSHQNVHSSSREHYCVECNRYYKTERGLKKHYKDTLKHGGYGAIPRSQCDDKFHSETAVSSHVRVRHSTEYTCGVCNKNMNSRLIFAIVSSACWSAFQHGYNTGVLNTPQYVMTKWLSEDVLSTSNSTLEVTDPKVNTVWSVVVSIYCVGGMIGGTITGFVADRFGRKGGLLLNNILVFVAVGLEAFSKMASSVEMLILGRLVIGVNNGLNAGLAPMYLSEISPVSLRGSIGTVYQLVITMSILLSQVLGLSSVLGTDSWPWLLAVPLIPAVLQCCMLRMCPESPKYLLLNKGAELRAQRALNYLRGDVAVHGEMEEMRQEAEKNKVSKKVTLRELFRDRSLRRPLLVAVVAMVAQQFSGINVVIFFSTEIFTAANLSPTQSQYATLVCPHTALGPEHLHNPEQLSASQGTWPARTNGTHLLNCHENRVATTHIWVSYLCIALVILFVVTFAAGPGSIPWFLVTELFNQSSRPAASSVAVTVNWTANFIVGLSYLPLASVLKSNTFAIFAVLQFIFIIFIAAKVPETKNKTIEEITAMFRQQL
nr:solute carrier family 2, facilitated glucose transporter member 1-like [Danaus plexippus plexippus]